MTKRKTLTFMLFLVFTVSLVLFTGSFTTIKRAAADEETQTPTQYEGFTFAEDAFDAKVNENGETEFTNKINIWGISRSMDENYVGKYNTVEYDVKITGGEFLSFAFADKAGETPFLFAVLNTQKSASLYLDIFNGSELKRESVDFTDWVHIKLEYGDGYFRYTLIGNNTVTLEYNGAETKNLSKAVPCFYEFNVNYTVKNIILSNNEYTPAEPIKPDQPEDVKQYDGFTFSLNKFDAKVNDDGEIEFENTVSSVGAATYMDADCVGKRNVIEFDLNLISGEFISFAFVNGEGETPFLFAILNTQKSASLYLDIFNGSELKRESVDFTDWVHIKLEYGDGYFRYTLIGNNTVTLEYNGAETKNLSNSIPCFYEWNVKFAVKNIKVYKENSNIVSNENWTYEKGAYTKVCAIDSVAKLEYNGSMDVDTVEFDFVKNEVAADQPNMGVTVYNKDGNYYFIEFCGDGYAKVRLNGEWGSYASVPYPEGDYSLTAKIGLKAVFNQNAIILYINGLKAVEYIPSTPMEPTKIELSSWGYKPTVSNINVYDSNVKVAEWTPSSASWTLTEENGEEVYTNKDMAKFYTNLKNEGTYNTFTFDIRVNSVYSDYDSNIGASIKVGLNNFFFEYNPAPNRSYFRLRYFPDGSNEGYELARKAIKIAPKGEWVTIKVVFDTDYLVGYVNGVKAVSAFDTQGEDMSKAIAGVSTWNQSSSVKNMHLSTEELDYNSIGYVDLEFADEKAVAAMTATNSNLVYSDGKLVAQITGETPTITSPIIDVSQGNKYSAKLSVVNTLCIRLKNNTKADKLTIYFIHAEDTEYNVQKSKTFDIKPESGYETYYFNLSDVADCGEWETAEQLKQCNHYLRGFKFEFGGINEGSIEIDAITFEREDKIYEKAIVSMSAIADKENGTVTVSGKLLKKYAGMTVNIIETEITNYNQLINWKNNKLIASAKANDVDFSVTSSLYRDGMTHLSTWFLASIGNNGFANGIKACDSFQIENWRDFSNNEYAFDLPSLMVDVCDYGAKGDGFTNDNAAIQSAIDYVSKQGGGTVVIKGDKSVYGKRYVVTNLEMKNNVELRIEKGAILLQSQRYEDYNYGNYSPVYTHDVTIPNCPWTHAAVCWNKPLIYAKNCQNIKITGGGTIRMMDSGTECLDGNRYDWDSDITVNCNAQSVIHLNPIVTHSCENVEISDITVKRASIWQIINRGGKNIFVGNVNLTEISCVNGDGFNFSGSSNVIIDRCSLYSNDDAIIISSGYGDPRGDITKVPYTWQTPVLNGTNNIKIVHNNIFGGHGVTFIPWGSGYFNEEAKEIYDIYIEDNVLGGTSTAIGCWTDNPFYGESCMGTYNQLEDNDWSPIRDLYAFNNIYMSPTLMGTWEGNTPAIATVTNALTDCGIYAPSQFVNGNFDKNLRYDTEKDWTTGLAYWSRKGNVGTEVCGTKISVSQSSGNEFTVNDYAGYIDGNGLLYQGIYKIFGNYNLNMKVKLVSGSAKLFVKDAVTGDILAEKLIDSTSEEFVTYSLPFGILKNSTVQLGIEHIGEEGTKVYIDDASVTDDENSNPYVVEGTEYSYDFTEDYQEFTTYTTSAAKAEIKDGKLVFESAGEVKYMWNNVNPLSTFEVTMNVVLKSNMNVGLYLFATNVSPEPDSINAYNVQFEKDANGNYKVSLYRFNGKYGGCATTKNVEVSGNDYTIKVVALKSTILVFVNDETKPLFAYEVEENLTGNIGIRSQYQASEINSLKIISSEAQLAAGDSSNLNTLIETAKTYKEYDYTEATYSVLKTALAEAEKAVGLTQYKIDKAYETLYNALMSLERMPAGDKTQLNALIATAKGVDQSKYTADSYAVLKSALKAAEDLDENATQGAIDEAYKALDEAYNALEEKPTDPDTDSSTDTGSASDSGSTTDSGSQSEEKTGCFGGIETSSVMLFMLGMVAVYAIVKKRRVNE